MLIVVFLLLFSVIIGCLYFSKKYIAPIVRGLERIKQSQTAEACNIAEIDDLFEFLSQKDSEYEKSLAALSRQNEQAQYEISRVQTENERLASTQKKMVPQEDYEFFLTGLKQLTPTEKAIFNLYLDGKSAAEIMEIMTIKQTTLKYHNRNIYSKLGVSQKTAFALRRTVRKRKTPGIVTIVSIPGDAIRFLLFSLYYKPHSAIGTVRP